MINNNKEKETDGHTGIIHSSPLLQCGRKTKAICKQSTLIT